MPRQRENLVTVLGSAYFQPIADLIEQLLNKTRRRPNRIQSGYFEHSYSVPVVLLLVAMFESYMARVRYIQKAKVPSSARSAMDVVLSVFPRIRNKAALEDVYVLRDLLMHSHLWVIEYEWGGPVPMVLKKADLHPGYGDKKFWKRVNFDAHRTKALKLSIFPSRIDRRDVLKVFDTLWGILLRFERQDRNQCNVSNYQVRFAGKKENFGSLREKIRNSL